VQGTALPLGLHHHLTESHNPVWKPEDWAVPRWHPKARRASTYGVSKAWGKAGDGL